MNPQDLDSAIDRKSRGAFFTPRAIADYLAGQAIEGDPNATVFDPTCGESVFLEAATQEFRRLGTSDSAISDQLYGVDIHKQSLVNSQRILGDLGVSGNLFVGDFFEQLTPAHLGSKLPHVDVVIGNPPFVRYQEHSGLERKRAQQAALAQGVRLSGLASSWAASLVHASSFLKPDGRLAMVLPAELLSTGYAEPVRRWLKRRFKAVHLVMFERLQFSDAQENVVLLLARGTGGCSAFSLIPVDNANDLENIRLFGPMHLSVAPSHEGKWTDFLLPVEQRQILDRAIKDHFVPLDEYGSPTLGSVTGANSFFCITDSTREEYEIDPRHLRAISPPGTKHLLGTSFTAANWRKLRDEGARVWMINPDQGVSLGQGLLRYISEGEAAGVPDAYKCKIRDPWYSPPVAPAPDLFFTYMSHRYPRLISNRAKASFVNSMHGVRLRDNAPAHTTSALPLLMLNSATMLGAEIFGRSYGGGVLKMEPREAASLPVPGPDQLLQAWKSLQPEKAGLERQLRQGIWTSVVKRVDAALLRDACGFTEHEVMELHSAARSLRERRMGR